MDLLKLLQSQMGSGILDQLSQQSNATPQQTESAVSGMLGALLGGISQNASTPQGAEQLDKALAQDHTGGLLDNILGLIKGDQVPPEQERAANGAGILGHIFGEKIGTVVDGISQSSGIDTAHIGQMLIKLAPIVMGVLGNLKSSQGLNGEQISGVLSQTVEQNKSENPLLAMAGKLLDRNGDGNYMDDLGSIGMSVLGNLFNK